MMNDPDTPSDTPDDTSDRAPRTQRRPEVERKFDVIASTVSPSFEGITWVDRVEKSRTQSLDAVYFDTPKQDLARNMITLRRRTGGNDAGWHLKLAAGPDTRTEITAPLALPGSTGDTVPSELLDVVQAIVRDRPLVPVARIKTERENQLLFSADGAALATFSNDNVTAWSAATCQSSETTPPDQEWREWEIELVDANATGGAELLSRLSNRLLDAGAAPAGHGSKLARVLGTPPDDARLPEDPLHRAVAEQVEQLLVCDRAVRADAYDSVHQMRVATRKIRSLLRDSQDSFGLSDKTEVLSELRELAGILGVARDAEVLAQRYETLLNQLAPDLVRGPIWERLVKGSQQRYQVGLRRSLIAMRSRRYFRLLDALESMIAEVPVAAPGEEATAATASSIDGAYRKVRKAAKAAATLDAPDHLDDENAAHRDEALHRIRKRAKRLRYTAAATGAEKVEKQAKIIQTLLGDHQDSVVSREHLACQAHAAHRSGEDTFTYGLLYQQEADMAESCRRQLGSALRKLARAVRKTRE